MAVPVWLEVNKHEYLNVAEVRRIKLYPDGPPSVHVEYSNGDGATIPLDPRLKLFWLDYLFGSFTAGVTRQLEREPS